jgi:uncharacterized protein (TIGR02996 family)
MRDEATFVQSLAAAPDDEPLRLAYADWLEENGQLERAELIRVQAVLADPTEERAEYRALRVREAALLDAYGKRWFGALKKLGVRAWTLRRGLVERVTMSAPKFLEHGERLLALEPIHSVKLSDARAVIAALAQYPPVARLSELDLSGNKLREVDVRALLSPRLSGIRRLDLSDNPLGPAGVAALTASPYLTGLRRLALRGVKMGCDGARALAGHVDWARQYAKSFSLAGLATLDLRENELYEEGVCILAHSPHLAGLTELSLSPVWGKSAEALSETRYLRKLTTLRISGPFSHGIPGLLSCGFVRRLRVLDLRETEATDEHAEEIADSPHLKELRHLSLSGNEIGDTGLRALASRARMPRLRWLDLSRNLITSDGVSALCASALVREIRELNLADNSLDDGGAKALAVCPHLSRLYGLSLSRNAITATGAVALAGSPLLRQLEALSLNGNPIGENGCVALVRAADKAGIPQRGGNDFWVDPGRSRCERYRGWE